MTGTAQGSQEQGRFDLPRTAAIAAATAVATWVTLLSYYGPTQIALAAPLAGVIVVLALTASRQSVTVDLSVMAIVVTAVVGIQVDSWNVGLVGGLTSLAQGCIVVAVCRGFGRWPAHGRPQIVGVADLPVLALAVLLAATGSSLMRWTGLGLVAPSDFDNVLLAATRTMTWGASLGSLGLLWASGERFCTIAQARGRGVRIREILSVLAATVVMLVLAFPQSAALPVIFPLFLSIVWAATRLRPLAAVSFAFGIGVVSVLSTLFNLGSFAQVSDTRIGAMLAQSFMLTLVVITLTLSLTSRDRELALVAAAESARDARDRAWELDLVLANLAEGVVLFDGDGRIVLRNRAGRRMFGREHLPEPDVSPSGDILGLRNLDGTKVSPDLISNPIATSTDAPDEIVLRLVSSVSADKVLKIRTQRVDAEEAGRSLVVVTFHDITQDHQRTEELQVFAGVLAHDLSGPLSIIHGWSEILRDEARLTKSMPSERVASDADRITAASESMRQLLDDMLSLTLADGQRINPVPVNVSNLCHEILVTRNAKADATVEIDDDLWVCGDLTLLRQLFDNLMSNAIKYSASGKAPRISVRQGRSSRDWLRVEIQDNGTGIPAEDIPHIFDDFYRARQHRGKFSGTGIGLAICRRVVDRHDGRISILSSSPITGTCVQVSLPRAQPAEGRDDRKAPDRAPS